MLEAIINYALDGVEPKFTGYLNAMWTLILPALMKGRQLYENGTKGGRPKNQNETKTKPNSEKVISNKKPNSKKVIEGEKPTPSMNSNNISSTNVADSNIISTGVDNNKKRNIFIKPTISEVEAYCKERGNGIDAQGFVDYYESKGWLIGKSPMKDWRAAVRTWERNHTPMEQPTPAQPEQPNEPEYKWGSDPELPSKGEWEAFNRYVEALGGLDITPYQFTDIKVMMRNFNASQDVFKEVINECCRRGRRYLTDNLKWKVQDIISDVLSKTHNG